ncbi:MAG TPA: hypothetical protein VGD58_12705 [Herpetosiphonaceae bacterium]
MPACLPLLRHPLGLLLALLLLVSSAASNVAVARSIAPSAAQEAVACTSAISFGETRQCSVESEGESDTFTFTAAANDEIKVRMVRLSGDLNPAVHIYNSSSTSICSAFTSDKVVEIGHCTIPTAGSYKLVADDTYRTNTGSYYLYVQRLNNPGNAQPINFGQTQPGAIELDSEIDSFSFRAAGGTVAKIRMTRAANTLRPRIRIYDPAGNNICSDFSSSETTEISRCDLPLLGTYTILADDTGSRLGSYSIYLECVEGECSLATERIYLPLIAYVPGLPETP